MNIKIQVLIILAVLAAMLYIINKIRTKGIELKYCLLWLLLELGIIVFAGFPQLSKWLSHLLGISQPVNMLFFAGFCFTLPIIFSLFATVSKMSEKVKRLTQELALMNEKLEREEKRKESSDENESGLKE